MAIADAAIQLNTERSVALIENRRTLQDQTNFTYGVPARNTETVDPANLRIEPQDLPERQRCADDEYENNQTVQGGIRHERDFDLFVQDKDDRAAKRNKNQHPQQKNARR